jgi:hypothetical protein
MKGNTGMFESFICPKAFRVDYINPQAAHTPQAFALYVRGEMDDRLPYSLRAKHHLIAGLALINEYMERDYLVAVYIDIAPLSDCSRQAYAQMKDDIAEGMFNRVLTVTFSDIMGEPDIDEDILTFARRIPDLQLLTLDGDRFSCIRFENPYHSLMEGEREFECSTP